MDTAKAVGSKSGEEMECRDISISYTLQDVGEAVEVKLPEAAQLCLER